MEKHKSAIVPQYLLYLTWSTFARIACEYSVRILVTNYSVRWKQAISNLRNAKG